MVLRPRKAAELLGISRAALYRWEAAGILPRRVTVGPGVSGWLTADLEAFLATRERGGFARPTPGRAGAPAAGRA
jgi:predicted DNA-binding transcriptional regulator AlpA